MDALALAPLWNSCVDRLKDRINNRGFWEAVEQTKAIAVENGTLIIGMETENLNRASLIQQNANMRIVQEEIETAFGSPLTVRIIEGTTPADWESAKRREAQAALARQQEAAASVQRVTPGAWEGVGEAIGQLYTSQMHRSLPQGKARFANEALYALLEAMGPLYSEAPSEQDERHLARVIERIARDSEIPAPVLAFELERLRAWQRAGAETEDSSTLP